MKRIEAPTLEEAYAKASKLLGCSVSELQSEVIQHPNNGILGFMKKGAIIVASCKNVPVEVFIPKEVKPELIEKEEVIIKKEIFVKKIESKSIEEAPKDAVLDAFFESKEEIVEIAEEEVQEEDIVYDELALVIENQIKELFSHLCFNIDVIEVDVRDNTALIFIDGEDAALLIGKEGYRYNALSYMLFNWLHSKYELFIKLEIAEFLTKQQEMISSYILPVIANVEKNGKGRTHFLDGILVQIALEQLRERFPDKYVAIKTGKEGKKFVVINAFNSPNKPKIQ